MRKIILVLILFYSSNVLSSTLVVNKVFPGTVLITAEDKHGQQQSLGSGFLVTSNIIATNFHVIENSHSGFVKFVNKNEIYEIEGVVGYSAEFDLALIKISNNTGTPLSLTSPTVDIGQKIFAIGNPLGLEGTISDGIISGIRNFEDFSVLQISAPISPGNSGGPVVDENGDVVGVATFTITEGQNINFAVPVKYLRELLDNQTSQVKLASLVGIKIPDNKGIKKDFKGVSLTKFDYPDWHCLGFSVKNNLRQNIERIWSIWILYDEDGEPLDYFNSWILNGIEIKAKLAKRDKICLDQPTYRYIYNKWKKNNNSEWKRENINEFLEIRILDFKVVE